MVHLTTARGAAAFIATIVAGSRRILRLYVQELIVSLGEALSGWIYQFVQVIPPLLPNLLHFEYCDLPILHPRFYALTFRSRAMSSLALEHLRHQSFVEILGILRQCKALRYLRMYNCEWRPSSTPYPPRGCALVSLSLSFTTPECRNDVLRWLATTNSASALQHLYIMYCELPAQDPPHLRTVLEQCAETLKELVLGVHLSDDTMCVDSTMYQYRTLTHNSVSAQ